MARPRPRLNVDVDGADRVRAALQRIPGKVRAGGESAVSQAGEAMADEVRANVRIESGRLRDSVAVNTDGTSASVGYGADVDYAAFQEFGTSSIPANPALTAAAEGERGKLPDRVAEAVNRELR